MGHPAYGGDGGSGVVHVSLLERFWSKVDAAAGPDACWLWRGAITPEGYGILGLGRPHDRAVNEYAHRLAYVLAHRVPVPPRGAMTIDHRCRTRACCNPRHLELVTQRENLLRGAHRAAACARRQACTRGHPWARDAYRRANGWRYCRQCERANRRRRRASRQGPEAVVNGAAPRARQWH